MIFNLKPFKSKRGFTLIEAVLAIGLIGAGLVGLLVAFQGMTGKSLKADQTIVAVSLAKEVLEKIAAQRDSSGYATTLSAINTSNSYDENPITGFSGYSVDTTATEVDPDDDDNVDDFLDAQASSGYARIIVVVSFNGGNDTVKLESLMVNY